MRFWVSASLTFFLCASIVAAQQEAVPKNSQPVRDNEWKLAGLLPGHTTVKRAEALLGNPQQDDPNSSSASWHTCWQDQLVVDYDKKGIVQLVRLSKNLAREKRNDCSNAARNASSWMTGKGLRLGSPAGRVKRLYGEPDSRSPSTRDGQRLELLYYAFDWAGPDVPQVMEVLCTVGSDGKPGVVVEITLAASSL
jgi:hypothetical protein